MSLVNPTTPTVVPAGEVTSTPAAEVSAPARPLVSTARSTFRQLSKDEAAPAPEAKDASAPTFRLGYGVDSRAWSTKVVGSSNDQKTDSSATSSTNSTGSSEPVVGKSADDQAVDQMVEQMGEQMLQKFWDKMQADKKQAEQDQKKEDAELGIPS
jgi:hypothetical protein